MLPGGKYVSLTKAHTNEMYSMVISQSFVFSDEPPITKSVKTVYCCGTREAQVLVEAFTSLPTINCNPLWELHFI